MSWAILDEPIAEGRKHHMAMNGAFAAVLVLGFFCATKAHGAESWTVVVGDALAEDEAVRVAVEDLRETGTACGIEFSVTGDTVLPDGDVLVLGAPARNAQTARLVSDGILDLDAVDDEQGYTIRTVAHEGNRIVVVTGGSVIGEVYGLYWVWDRIRVHKRVPDINVTRIPALKVRVGAAWGRHGHGGSNREQMRAALRHTSNWVAGPNVLDLVPWDAEPERATNAENREKTQALIAYAHALHMKYFSFSNEFTYHPSLLEEHGATLSPDDPKLWDAVQGKFRKLFEALPELDGIELCNDDISGFWDNYKAYDVLHENPECDWSYPKRFRTFVKNVREVVADEFGKTYFHFTWGLTAHEQHCQAEVFREIFTDDVPAEGLYLMPKITTADRWWHQPYNPTFNQTPHDTVVCFEMMNYYEGGHTNIFPTFSGQYFQAGLQTFLLPENCNLKGAATLAGVGEDTWDTRSAYAYVLNRLMWDPDEDMATIARDFCAIHFGPEAADAMAEIYLLSPSAYKYGLHIEPVSYGQYNSFLHMRVGIFPVEGYPTIDGGREHLEFLREIYLRCKPWKTETLLYLEHGLSVADTMVAKFEAAKSAIADPELAREVEERLNMTRLLIDTNIGYVRTTFALFDYLDAHSEENRAALAEACGSLVDAREAFVNAPGFGYTLFGVDQVIKNARAALDDVGAARTALERAPTRSQLEETIAGQQRRYAEVLEQYASEAVHFAHFEAMIDGRDILSITGDKHRIDHLRWDGPEVKECSIRVPLPREAVTVVPKDIYSRPIHPFVLEQPTEVNDYTVRIYLDDLPGGKDWVICDLYYIPRPPKELGLELPWGE
jgi:Domain of unknown function (DUF4838)